MNSLKTISSHTTERILLFLCALVFVAVPVSTAQALATPQRLFATVLGDTSVQLQWRDMATNENNYLIEAKIGVLGAWTQVGSTLMNDSVYVLGGRTANTLYYYRVRARNFSLGFSDYSNEAVAKQTNGSFTSFPILPKPVRTRGVLAGDLKDDGVQRIIATSQTSDSVYIYSRPLTTWVVEQAIDLPGTMVDVSPIAVGDIDNDGKTEFIVGNASTGTLFIYEWNGAAYSLKQSQAIGAGYSGVIVDLDRDGQNELILSSSGVRVYRWNAGTGTLQLVYSAPSFSSFTLEVAVGDPDGDGAPEVCVFGSGGIQIVGYNGASFEVEGTVTSFTQMIAGGAFADFDGDGKDELVTAVYNVSGTIFPIFVIKEIGRNSFVVDTVAYSDRPFWQIRTGDIDGDGTPEAVLASTDMVILKYANSVYTKILRTDMLTGGSVDVKDVDRDGAAELIGSNDPGPFIGNYNPTGGIPADAAPVMPTGFTAQSKPDRIRLIWNRNHEEDFEKYRIYYGTAPNPTNLLKEVHGSFNTALEAQGFAQGTDYFFRITAVDVNNHESPAAVTNASIARVSVDEAEVNNDTTMSQSIVYGETVNAALGSASDVDYFKFYGTAGDTVHVRALAEAGSTVRVRMDLWTASGSFVKSEDRYPASQDLQMFAILGTTGKHYLRVRYYTGVGTNFPNSILPSQDERAIEAGISASITAIDSGKYRLTLDRLQPTGPVVSNPSLSGTFTDEAQFSLYVNPVAHPLTALRVEYGTTPALGSALDAPSSTLASLGSGLSYGYAIVAARGLLPSTAYFYRVVAITSAGSTASVQGSFTTSDPSPFFTRHPLEQLIPFRGIAIPERQTVVAGTEYGTIARSTDGGATWTQNNLVSSVWDIGFATNTTGVTISLGSAINRTTDGGQSWVGITSPVSGVRFHDVRFGTATNGLIAGSGGKMLRTSNAGASWDTVSTGTSSWFWNVAYATPSIACAVGDGGMIRRTTDGGTTWAPVTSGVSAALYAVYFADALNGYAAGGGRTVLKTTDGGLTWTNLTAYIPMGFSFYGMAFSSVNIGYIVGDLGTVIKTTDGGTTWEWIPAGTGFFFWNVATDGRRVYVVGGGGGLFEGQEQLVEAEPNNDSTHAMTVFLGDSVSAAIANSADVDYYAFDLAQPDTVEIRLDVEPGSTLRPTMSLWSSYSGWYAGSTAFPSYQRERLAVPLPAGRFYLRVSYVSNGGTFPNSSRRGPVEESLPGEISMSVSAVDSGKYFLKFLKLRPVVPEMGSPSIISLFADEATTYFQMHTMGSPTTITVEYGTTTAYGQVVTQTPADNPQLDASLWAFYPFVPLRNLQPSTLYHYRVTLTNALGSVVSADRTLTTPAASDVMTRVVAGTTGDYMSGAQILNSQRAFVSSSSAMLHQTSDGGTVWRTDPTPFGMQYVSFVNDSVGYGFEYSAVWKTTNRGSSWTIVQGGLGTSWFERARFLAPQRIIGIAVGDAGLMARTTDGGVTWTNVSLPLASAGLSNLYDVSFVSSSIVVAVGGYPRVVLRSTNAGAAWDTVYAPTNATLYSVAFTDGTTGYIGGQSNTLLKTTDAGLTWTSISSSLPAGSGTLYGATFNGPRGYLVGSGGRIVQTTDGGSTWSRVLSGTTNLIWDVACAGRLTLAVGGGGTILQALTPILEIEPNEDTTHAMSLALNDVVNASISGTTDVDYYMFDMSAPDTLEFSATSDPGSGLNFMMELRSRDGGWWGQNGGFPSAEYHRLVQYLPAGRYYLKVAHGYNSTSFPNSVRPGDDPRRIQPPGVQMSMAAAGDSGAYTLKFQRYRATRPDLGSYAYLTSISAHSAMIQAQFSSPGYPATVRVEYGSSPGTYTMSETAIGTLQFTPGYPQYIYLPLRNLAPSTTYYYRVVAENAVGVTATNPSQVSTPPESEYWTTIPAGEQDAEINAVQQLDDQIAFASGRSYSTYANLLYKTFDAGATGSIDTIAPYFYDFWFFNTLTGVGMSYGGQFYQTTDGGLNWTPQSSASTQYLWKIAFLPGSSTIGVAVGDNGTIVRTIDGGQNWGVIASNGGTAVRLSDVFFANSLVGYAVGDQGTILRTADGGLTWARPAGTLPSLPQLNGVWFTSAVNGFVVGAQQSLYQTTNAGVTWTQVILPSAPYYLNRIFFANDNTQGFIIGDGGNIFFTDNGGATWTQQSSGTYNWLSDGSINGRTVLVVGTGGTILKSQLPKVESLEPRNNRPALADQIALGDVIKASIAPVGDVDFYTFTAAADDTVEFFAESSPTSTLHGELMLVDTTTGLKLLSSAYQPTPFKQHLIVPITAAGSYFLRYAHAESDSGVGPYQLRMRRFVPSKPEIVFGAKPVSLFYDQAYMTAMVFPNGAPTEVTFRYGLSTVYEAPPVSVAGPVSGIEGVLVVMPTDTAQRLSANTRYNYRAEAVNEFGNALGANNEFRTPPFPDGWNHLATSGTSHAFFGLHFLSPQTGIVVGGFGTVLQTTDGGASWAETFLPVDPALRSVTMVDTLTGFTVGDNGAIFATTDGGTNWTEQTSTAVSNLNRVRFRDPLHGVIVGDHATILTTSNGGSSWQKALSLPIASDFVLRSAALTDTAGYLVVGTAGMILRSTNNGASWSFFKQIDLLPGDQLTDIAVVNPTTWVVITGSSRIFRTTDAGTNWAEVASPATAGLLSLRFTDQTSGVIVGAEGTILRTTNAGASWNREESGTTNALFDVSYANADTVLAAGWYGTLLRYDRPPTPPETPLLASPVDGASGQPLSLTVRWYRSTGATSYHIQISSDAGFAAGYSLANDSTRTDTSFVISGLQYNTTYYWRVRARNVIGASAFSAARTFVTAGMPVPPAVALSYPGDGSAGQSRTPRLGWFGTPITTKYQLVLASDSDFVNIVLDDAAITDTFKLVTAPLNGGAEYFWKVRAYNNTGWGSYSPFFRFITTASAAIVQTLPATNVTSSSVVLNGVVNPSGTTQTVYFEYGELGQFNFSSRSRTVIGTSDVVVAEAIADSTIKSGKIYNFRIVASATGVTARGDSLLFAPGLAPPAAPTALRARVMTLSLVQLTWTASSTNESGFAVYRRLAASASFDSLGKVDAGQYQFNDDKVAADAQYYYRVRAYNLAGTSAWADSAGVLVKFVPRIVLSKPSLDYGNVEARFSLKDTVLTISNDGSDNLAIDVSQPVGPDAAQFQMRTTPSAASIGPQSSKDYVVRFQPTKAGSKVAALQISSNDPLSPSIVVALAGVSTDMQAPGVPIFPTVSPGTWSNAQQFTVTWTDPNDASGIRNLWYLYDQAPSGAMPGSSVAVRFSGVNLAADVPAPAVAGTHAVYFYMEDSSGNRNLANTAQLTVQSDRTMPSLVHNNAAVTTMRVEGPSTVNPNSAAISASATEGSNESGIESMWLDYRRVDNSVTGTLTYTSPFTSQSVQIPGNVFIQDGHATAVEYRVSVRDNAQNTQITSWYSVPAENSPTVVVNQPSAIPAASANPNNLTAAYRIFSVPYILTDKKPGTHLAASLGGHSLNGVDYANWRFQRYLGTQRQDYETFKGEDAFVPGNGFFLIVRDPGTKRVQVQNATSSIVKLDDLRVTGIPLTAGWNIVGTPLPIAMQFSELSFSGGTILDRAYYSGSGLASGWDKTGANVDVLKPWEGMAINVSANGSLRYRVVPPAAGETTPLQANVAPHTAVAVGNEQLNWYVPIDVERADNGVRSSGNGFGMASDALAGFDRYDSFQPPLVGDRSVALYFENTTNGFMQDVRPVAADGAVWNMLLATGDAGAKLHLTFGSVAALPDPAFEVFLVDMDQRMAYDLKRTSAIDVNSGNGMRQFRIVAGSKTYVESNSGGVDLYPKTMVLSSNYPNPFNPETVIRYTVPNGAEQYRVTLQVYNLLGQMVATLVDEDQQTGYYEAVFNGRTFGSGVYFYRITVRGGGKEVLSDIRKMVLLK